MLLGFLSGMVRSLCSFGMSPGQLISFGIYKYVFNTDAHFCILQIAIGHSTT